MRIQFFKVVYEWPLDSQVVSHCLLNYAETLISENAGKRRKREFSSIVLTK